MTEPFQPHQRITGDTRQHLQAQVLEQYNRGVAIRTLADQYNRSYGFIHRLLSDAGVEFRSRGGRHKNRGLTRKQQAEYDARLRAKR